MKNRSCATRALTALLLTLAMAGCSKPSPAKTGPLVSAPASEDTSAIRGSLSLGTTNSKYIARVQNGRIASIDEVRIAHDGQSTQATYSFYEARLMKYRGDGITASGHEDVEFDLRGAIKQSQSDVGTPSSEEISAIRNRAELLRSHALTQQTVQAHQPY